MKKIQKYICIFILVLIGGLCAVYILVRMKDPYEPLNRIKNKEALVQKEEEYYVYYYKKDCPYCIRVEDLILRLGASNEKLYIVNMGQKQNNKSFDWKKFHMEEDRKIGILNLDNSITFYDGESKEKYLLQAGRNKYGKIKVYEIKEADEIYIIENINAEIGYVYASLQTPEIDYEKVKRAEDIVIGGVPTLLHITKGRIDGFYFDAPEIAEHLSKILER